MKIFPACRHHDVAAALVLSMIMLPILVAAGCNRPSAPAREQERSQTLTILLEANVGEIDPRFALGAHGSKVARLIFDSLVTVDNLTSEPELLLASDYIQHDPVTYEFILHENVTFHDGHPLTAADVVYTYQSVIDPELSSPLAGMFERIDKVEELDPHRVKFTLNRPHAPFITDLTLGIVPRHILKQSGGLFTHPSAMVGSGSFMMEEHRGEELIILRRNPDHIAEVPHIERLAMKTIRDENSRVLALLGGSGDLIQNAISPLLIPTLEARPGISVITSPSVAYSYMVINLRDPILSDRRVRAAIAHAIDRESIIRSKLGGRAVLSTGMLAPDHWAYEPDVPSYDHDPEKARRLLDEAGFTHPAEDPDAPRFTITLKTSTDRFRRSVARVISHNLRQVGIQLEVQAFEFSTFFHDIRSGNFQLATLQWPSVQEPDMYNWIFHSQMIPTEQNRGMGANRGAYRNPEVDRLIELGRGVPYREERKKIYREIQKILARDLPYISLWHDHNVALVREDVRGYSILPNARFRTVSNVIKE